ncbi:hypothetical protein OH77DRAFT_1587641 [Trametes cingulata]|nr:hypothetical protein OH77DRAFT_1587641 [Trametes cingulata]
MAAPSSRDNSLASTQHATDRFPRFTYLLRTGTPKPEAEGGLERRSADPGEPEASLATIPDPPVQRGTGDGTCLQSCVASGSGSTWGASPRTSSSPSRASTPTTSAGTLATASVSVTASETLLVPAPYPMANNSATTSRGGASTQRLPVPTRRSADAIAGERITPGTPLSTSPQSQASSEYADAGAEADEIEQDDTQAGAQTAEGQPKKKKTRRAGQNITRVRRMQREVRRLAEDEEPPSGQRQQPQRSLLPGVQNRPSLSPPGSPPPLSPPPLSLHTPHFGQGQHMHMRALSPSMLSATRPTSDGRQPRVEPSPAAHSRGGSAYDRTLEDGDDVVVWRPTGHTGSSNIWAYRPDERPRGGSS